MIHPTTSGQKSHNLSTPWPFRFTIYNVLPQLAGMVPLLVLRLIERRLKMFQNVVKKNS